MKATIRLGLALGCAGLLVVACGDRGPEAEDPSGYGQPGYGQPGYGQVDAVGPARRGSELCLFERAATRSLRCTASQYR